MGLLNLFNNSGNVYFPGCYSQAFARAKISNYERILKKLGISFRTAEENVCCAGILHELGYDKETRKIARENLELLKSKNVKRVIVSCPLCYYMLSKTYKEMLPDWDIEVEHILDIILEELRNKKNISFLSEEVYYYDSCYMSRYLKMYNAPREILKILGFKLKEIFIPKEESLCCGSCGGFSETNSELANQIAIDFLRLTKRKGIKKIITSDISALKHLKENIYKLKEDLEIIDISDTICNALRIKKSKEDWE